MRGGFFHGFFFDHIHVHPLTLKLKRRNGLYVCTLQAYSTCLSVDYSIRLSIALSSFFLIVFWLIHRHVLGKVW